MDSILTIIDGPGNEMLKIFLLSAACMRIYLEIIGFDFNQLPLTKKIAQVRGSTQIIRWHRMGLIFSIGYLVFHAPQILLGS